MGRFLTVFSRCVGVSTGREAPLLSFDRRAVFIEAPMKYAELLDRRIAFQLVYRKERIMRVRARGQREWRKTDILVVYAEPDKAYPTNRNMREKR